MPFCGQHSQDIYTLQWLPPENRQHRGRYHLFCFLAALRISLCFYFIFKLFKINNWTFKTVVETKPYETLVSFYVEGSRILNFAERVVAPCCIFDAYTCQRAVAGQKADGLPVKKRFLANSLFMLRTALTACECFRLCSTAVRLAMAVFCSGRFSIHPSRALSVSKRTRTHTLNVKQSHTRLRQAHSFAALTWMTSPAHSLTEPDPAGLGLTAPSPPAEGVHSAHLFESPPAGLGVWCVRNQCRIEVPYVGRVRQGFWSRTWGNHFWIDTVLFWQLVSCLWIRPIWGDKKRGRWYKNTRRSLSRPRPLRPNGESRGRW